MSEKEIALFELILVGSIGLFLILLGLYLNVRLSNLKKTCTSSCEGKVVDYSFSGDGRMAPIIEFKVNDISYKTKKQFKGVKRIRITGLPISIQEEAYEKNEWLYIKMGPITNLRTLAESLWPLYTTMKVYFQPNNPKKNYVERPLCSTFTSKMFILIGIFVILLSILIYFLIQL